MDLNQGDVMRYPGGNLYRYERDGCATRWEHCPNEDPIAAIYLDRNGKSYKYDLTVCLERSKIVEVLPNGE